MRYLFVFAVLAIGSMLCGQSTDELRRSFDALAGTYPTHVSVRDLPGADNGSFFVSIRDREIDDVVPAVLLLGSLHGRETAPGAASLQVAQRLLEDKALRDQFSHCELILIPVPNPGGRVGGLNGVPLPFDDDRDGRSDEDGPSDINGDGVISQMRVRRDGGRYVASKFDARVLVEAAPGEDGEWDVLWEGQDDDGDGRINEDAEGTITLANDWSIRWSRQQQGANRFMMQLKETRALAEFVVKRPQIVAAFQLRSIGDGPAFANGPKVQKEDAYARDKKVIATLEKAWKEAAGKQTPSTVKPGEEGAGNVLDWLYESQGALSANLFLAPISTPKQEKEEDKEEEDAEEKEEGEEEKPKSAEKPSDFESAQMAWLNYAPDDYLEWKTFEHPQLGEVEIGGWKITARHNPNAEDTESGAARIAQFLKHVLRSVPRLAVSKVEVEDKGNGLYRVRATLHNAGTLDYRSAFAEKNRIGLPVFVSLSDTKDVELISGTRRQRVESIEGDGTATFEWFVRVSGDGSELNFSIESERTGKREYAIAVKDCDELKLREDEE